MISGAKILDLGCGTAKEPGSFGVDVIALPGIDAVVDLSHLPLPFAENSSDSVYLNDVIEHLPDVVATMEEIYRICRPGARVFIRVVNWNSHHTAMDPTHKHAFTANSFDFFGVREARSYYTTARYEVIQVRRVYNRRVQRVLRSRRLMQFLSDYLCNILQGLHFELRVVKPDRKAEEFGSGDWRESLRCPRCVPGFDHSEPDRDKGQLRSQEDGSLICDCGLVYPQHNGIPVLVVREAEKYPESV